MSAPKVDPRTGQISWPSQRRGRALAPSPMRGRAAFRGFGDVPNQSGGPGPFVSPYYEDNGVYNPPPGAGTGAPAPVVSNSTGATPDPTQTGFLPGSAPYGESDRPWTNPTTFATVPINAATSIALPVLSQNFLRNALIIQNGSTATSPDVAPTLYIGFNCQPIVGSSLGLPPGVGVVFDIICPRDSIYIAFGPFSNGGGTVVIQGSVVGGTYAP